MEGQLLKVQRLVLLPEVAVPLHSLNHFWCYDPVHGVHRLPPIEGHFFTKFVQAFIIDV